MIERRQSFAVSCKNRDLCENIERALALVVPVEKLPTDEELADVRWQLFGEVAK